jgi:hypothetical protein
MGITGPTGPTGTPKTASQSCTIAADNITLTNDAAAGLSTFQYYGTASTAESGTVSRTWQKAVQKQVISAIQISGTAVQVKYMSIDVFEGVEDEAWTTIHTGTECTGA